MVAKSPLIRMSGRDDVLDPSVGGPSVRILVCDEDPVVFASIKDALQEPRHLVENASSEEEIHEAVVEPFDIVFLHQGLPNSKLHEIVRRARSVGNPAIILLSSEQSVEVDRQHIRLGVDETIHNPLSFKDIRANLHRPSRSFGRLSIPRQILHRLV